MARADQKGARAIEVITSFESTVLTTSYLGRPRVDWGTGVLLGSVIAAFLALLGLFGRGGGQLSVIAAACVPAAGVVVLYGIGALAAFLYRFLGDCRGQTYTVGPHPRADFPLDIAGLPTTRFPLLRVRGQTARLQLTENFQGEMELAGVRRTLDELRRDQQVGPVAGEGAWGLSVPWGAHVVVRWGAVRFAIQWVERPRPHALAPAVDVQALGYHGGVLLVVAAFLAILFAVPADPLMRTRTPLLLDAALESAARVYPKSVHVVLAPSGPTPPTENWQRLGFAPGGQRATGGRMSRGSGSRTPSAVARPGQTHTISAAAQAAQRDAIVSMFRSGQPALAALTQIGTEPTLGDGAAEALQQLGSTGHAEVSGEGEHALVGSGRGLGDLGEKTIAGGAIDPDTSAPETSTCDGDDRCEAERQRKLSQGTKVPQVLLRRPVLETPWTFGCACPSGLGSLDKEVIRRVIRSHLKEIKFCYEQQLIHDASLQGRVEVQLTITPSGRVESGVIKSSTVNDSGVETCITNAVRRWEFPASTHAGISVVSYPFVLTLAED